MPSPDDVMEIDKNSVSSSGRGDSPIEVLGTEIRLGNESSEPLLDTADNQKKGNIVANDSISCLPNGSSHDSHLNSSDSRSRSSSPGAGLLTDNMLKEEERLKEGELKIQDPNVQKVSNMVESQRYARLQHLLDKSSIFSKLLLKKMEDQMEANKKESLRKKRVRKRKNGDDKTKDKSTETTISQDVSTNIKMTRSKSQKRKADEESCQSTETSNSQDASKKNTNIKMTRSKSKKRKADEESYQLCDFMDSEGKLKKRPRLETSSSIQGKDKDADKIKSLVTDPDGHVTEDMEIEEERYFEGKPIPVTQPKLVVGGIMRPYQLEGMEWLKVLYENGINGILADEMGLGKTLQCIAVIAHLVEMGVKGPFLVVAPLSTVPNWVAEFKRFTPSIPVVLYHGVEDERYQMFRKMFPRRKQKSHSHIYPVVVTSYGICMNDYKLLADKEWKFLVVDEGHRIKNLNCKLIRILKTYNAANRLLLTGTPLQNNLAELWSLLNFLLPDIFDDLNSFQSWFDFSSVVDEKESSSHIIAREREENVLTTLHEILTPFLLRRLKTDVELCIPPKKEILVYAPLTEVQEKYYTGILNETIMDVVEKERKKTLEKWDMKNQLGYEGEKENVSQDCSMGVERRPTRNRKQIFKNTDITDEQFEDILTGDVNYGDICGKVEHIQKTVRTTSVSRIKMTSVWVMLRKCCNHPYLLEFPMTEDGEFKIDSELISSCGKMLLLDRMLPALLERGHKVLVFSQMTQLLDLLEDYMDIKGLRYARLDGTMSYVVRDTEMTRFRESPDCNVFLLSTRAGGLGINLTAADTVIIYDSDWNPQVDLQAQDRCHRIGQTKPVIIYRYVTANTVDQHIVERAAGKRRLEKIVIHKGKFKGYNKGDTQLTLDDLVELLKSVDHDKVVKSHEIISDSALEALLDRNFTSENGLKSVGGDSDGVDEHAEVFKVIEKEVDGRSVLKSVNVDVSPTKRVTDVAITTTEGPVVTNLVVDNVSPIKMVTDEVTEEPLVTVSKVSPIKMVTEEPLVIDLAVNNVSPIKMVTDKAVLTAEATEQVVTNLAVDNVSPIKMVTDEVTEEPLVTVSKVSPIKMVTEEPLVIDLAVNNVSPIKMVTDKAVLMAEATEQVVTNLAVDNVSPIKMVTDEVTEVPVVTVSKVSPIKMVTEEPLVIDLAVNNVSPIKMVTDKAVPTAEATEQVVTKFTE